MRKPSETSGKPTCSLEKNTELKPQRSVCTRRVHPKVLIQLFQALPATFQIVFIYLRSFTVFPKCCQEQQLPKDVVNTEKQKMHSKKKKTKQNLASDRTDRIHTVIHLQSLYRGSCTSQMKAAASNSLPNKTQSWGKFTPYSHTSCICSTRR